MSLPLVIVICIAIILHLAIVTLICAFIITLDKVIDIIDKRKKQIKQILISRKNRIQTGCGKIRKRNRK